VDGKLVAYNAVEMHEQLTSNCISGSLHHWTPQNVANLLFDPYARPTTSPEHVKICEVGLWCARHWPFLHHPTPL